MNIIKRMGFVLFLGFLLVSCEEGSDKDKIILGYVAWEEDVAMTNVVKTILNQNGYDVEFYHADIQPIFQRLLPKGRIDVFLDLWMPDTHRSYMEEHGDSLEILGDNYKNAKTGLAVPSYVPINSIDELNAHKDKFSRRITGIDIGAGIMKSTEGAIEEYDLEFELQPSTNFAMINALRKAIDDKKWIVVTAWTPHSMFKRFDIKMLEDPKNAYGEGENIQSVARKGFEKDHPFVAELLSNIEFSEDNMNDLLEAMEDARDEFAGAENWVNDNKELVESWMPDKKEEKLKDEKD